MLHLNTTDEPRHLQRKFNEDDREQPQWQLLNTTEAFAEDIAKAPDMSSQKPSVAVVETKYKTPLGILLLVLAWDLKELSIPHPCPDICNHERRYCFLDWTR